MSKKTLVQYVILSIATLGAIVSFVILFQNFRLQTAKAQENSLTFKIKLQGESYPSATVYSTVAIYTAKGKISELVNIPFSYQSDRLFWGTITFAPGFNYNDMYAFYIKPQAYFGKLFCSESIHGSNCTQPLFILKQSGSVIDLSSMFFSGGDIHPANGKVDAYDISKIISNLGKSTDISTDINNDGITNTIDYLLALYSLGSNMQDDAITINNATTPSVTPTAPNVSPTPTPFMITATPAPTLFPTNIPVPSPTSPVIASPTIAPTTPSATGICRVIDPWGTASDMKVGEVQCSCVMGICAQATCSSCTSSTPCECHPNSIPTDSGSALPCTNGGSLFMKKVSSC